MRHPTNDDAGQPARPLARYQVWDGPSPRAGDSPDVVARVRARHAAARTAAGHRVGLRAGPGRGLGPGLRVGRARRRGRRVTVTALALAAASVGVVTGPSWLLPAAGATGGLVVTDFPEPTRAHAVTVQPDRKIVVAGIADSDFAVVRYSPDGILDRGFGTGGRVTTDFGRFGGRAVAVQPGPGGTILVAGDRRFFDDRLRLTADFVLARYTAAGALDPTFGTGGLVFTSFPGTTAQAAAMAVQADGRIVLAGEAGPDIALARYLPDGALDPSFGSGGLVRTDFFGRSDRAFAVARYADGRILVAGDAQQQVPPNNVLVRVALARYTPTGALDPSFGSGGKVSTDLGGPIDSAADLVLQPDGRIVVAGTTASGGGFSNIAVARYTANGALDPGFGTGGRVRRDVGNVDEPHAVTVDPSGRVVVAGGSETRAEPFWPDFTLTAFRADGAPDPGFGAGGLVTTDFGNRSDTIYDSLRLPDGRLLAAGGTFDNSTGSLDVALARYNSDGALDPTFGLARTASALVGTGRS